MTPAGSWRLLAALMLTAAAAGGAACQKPEEKARKYLESGDAYAAQDQTAEALIEYRNAVKATPESVEAQTKLGRTYLRAGKPADALRAITRAADLRTSDAALQLEAGALQLLAGDAAGARTRAEFAIKSEPKNSDAHVLLGNAQAALGQTDKARRTLERAVRLDRDSGDALAALGSLYLAIGEQTKAEETLQRAVRAGHGAANARLALANYYWMSGDRAAAEDTLQEALDAQPQNTTAGFAMAKLYESTGRAAEAEPYYQQIAASGQPRAKLLLADYYLRTGRPADALAIAEGLTGDRDHGPAAALMAARAHEAAGRPDQALEGARALLAKSGKDLDARLMAARLLLDRHRDETDLTEALTHARAAAGLAPSLAEAQFLLGVAQSRSGNQEEAEAAFEATLRAAARHAGAQLALSELALARGDTARALTLAQQAAPRHPDRRAATLQLARALAASQRVAEARRTLAPLVAEAPDDPVLIAEQGRFAMAAGDLPAARTAFERLLETSPSSTEALEGLIAVDARAGRMENAVERVGARIADRPDDPRLRVMAARLDLARNRPEAAEASLREAIARDPANLEASVLLGQLYASRGEIDRAREEFRKLAALRPDSAAAARTMLGMLDQMQGRTAEATTNYEQALEADANALVAANNLAWLYAEQGRLDEAQRLAERAVKRLDTRPEVHDTLGWIYYRKNLPTRAIASFERSLRLAPRNATYTYHLALAHAQAGDRDAARQSLREAMKLDPHAPWMADAREKLAKLEAGGKGAAASR